MSNENLVRPRPPRVPFVRPVQVSRPDGSSAQWLLASNLSEGGMFVRAAEPPPVGTRLRLELEARGQNLTFAEGEVIWSRPMDLSRLNQGLPGFGLRFQEISEESRALVKHLVDQGGTGRGQAKTLAYTSPESLKIPSREPLHAPVAALVETLTPTEHTATSEFEALSPPPPGLLDEPVLDAASLRGPLTAGDDLEAELHLPKRRSGSGGLVAGTLLCAATIAAAVFAFRGFHEAASLPDAVPATAQAAAPEPVAPVAERPAVAPPPAPAASAPAAPAVVAKAPEPAPVPQLAAKVEPPAKAHAPEPARPVAQRPAPAPVAVQHPAGAIALPSGAATSVAVAEAGSHMEIVTSLSPGASIEKVFTLSGPERLVIDIKGAAPKGTPRVEGRSGVTAIRLGSRPGGTRLVLDLARKAGKVKSQGATILVELK